MTQKEDVTVEPADFELLLYDPYKICPKCNTLRGPQTALGIRYCPGSNPANPYQKDRCRSGVEPEHFHRVCTTCGYAWVEETLALGPKPQMLPYSSSNHCIHCGLAPVPMMLPQVKWCKGGKDCIEGLTPDHMHRSCVQCGFNWVEQSLNQKLMIGVEG